MPLFLRNRLLFIHIPKCGGDTITHVLREAGDPPFLFVADGSIMVNGHTPQHMIWREFLLAGWAPRSDFRVAALVRHPLDRVISAYRYVRGFRPDLHAFAPDPQTFLDEFLSHDLVATRRFDNHNQPMLTFLGNHDGEIDPEIEIYPVQEMDRFMQSLDLPPVPVTSRRNVTRGTPAEIGTFHAVDMMRVADHYARDIEWFESRFPGIRPELSK